MIIKRCLLLLALMLTTVTSFARVGVSVATGVGIENDLTNYEASVRWDWQKRWLEWNQWYVNGYWDAKIAYWRSHEDEAVGRDDEDELGLIGVAPVFRWQRDAYASGIQPFIEFAVGIVFLSESKLQGGSSPIRFDTSFQFQDRIGLGLRFGQEQQYEIAYRLIHYSNASISENNDGATFHVLNLGYWF